MLLIHKSTNGPGILATKIVVIAANDRSDGPKSFLTNTDIIYSPLV